MITGLKPDFMPRGNDRGLRNESSGSPKGQADAFADALMGMDRTERKASPGREFRMNADREGKRTEERDSANQRSEDRSVEKRSRPDGRSTDMKRKEKFALRDRSADADRRDDTRDTDDDSSVNADASSIPLREAPKPAMRRVSEPVESTGMESVSDASSVQNKKATSAVTLGSLGNSVEAEGGASAVKSPLQSLLDLQQEQVGARTKAMQDFMSQMQSELGIPPEKILQAFTQMDQASLLAKPEESMGQFLAGLGLTTAQQGRAAELYQSMVQETADAALGEKLAGLDSGVNFDVLSKRDDTLRKLNQSIDGLNTAFAMRDTSSPQVTVQAASSPNEALRAQKAVDQMQSQLAEMMRQNAEAKSMKGAELPEATPLLAGEGEEIALEGDDSGDVFAEALAGATSLAELATMLGAEGSASGSTSGFNSESGSSAQSQMIEKAAPQKAESTFGTAMKASDDSRASERAEAKSDSLANANGSVGAMTQTPLQPKAGATGPAAMMLGRPQSTPQDEQANVQELIRQAQLVLKKGGGEIKMDLKPEGIGQVRLKVTLDDGQVNVQMLTENDASKRLLEKGLSELKASLAAEQLQVENLKVDVGAEIKKHMDQNNSEANREQARQNASDFMQQFRQNGEGFRQGFMEQSGWRSYNRGQSRASVEPEAIASAQSAQSARAARSQGASSRLNLVA